MGVFSAATKFTTTDWEAVKAEAALRAADSARPSLLTLLGHPYNALLKPFRFKVIRGGRDSAKSWTIAEALIKLARRKRLRVLCTREFQVSIADSVHRLLKDTIERLGYQKYFTVTDKSIKSSVGSEFIFRGLHLNENEIKGIEGIDIVWLAEAQSTSASSLAILIPTIRKEGSEIWVDYNLIEEDAPVNTMFETEATRPPRTCFLHVNYDQNPFLSQVSLEAIEHLKRVDYAAYEHVYLGGPLKINDAQILAGKYRVEAFDDELWRQAERLLYGLDFGFARDPLALIRGFIIGNTLYISHEAYGVGVTIDETPEFLISVPGAKEWPIKADNARPEMINHLNSKGFNVSPADKWDGSVKDGIDTVRNFDEIIIHDRCKNTAQEARLWAYKKDRVTGQVLPVVVDANNHAMDAIRYSLDGYIQAASILGVYTKLA